MKHLFDIKQLNTKALEALFETADKIKNTPITETKKWLTGKTAMALFFENSTRTLVSFQLAAQRLGMDFCALNLAQSSTQKGETLKDTLLTLDAMQTDAFIIRHSENNTQKKAAGWLDNHSQASVINAGDGTNQHPTQGLLDLYTIRHHKGEFNKLKVSVIGDIKHSRVAGSLVDGLHILGNRNTWIYAPDALLPESSPANKAASMNQALQDADVVVMLRIQKERIRQLDSDTLDNWHDNFGLNASNIKLAKRDVMVMHPGPMNRGVEISSEVADGPQSVILEQVQNGVLMRSALLYHLLNSQQ
ncbi:aspartate carbamoyltransferase catalytic subunit [Marinicella rhabdoformis]|uniref:aspartate carbamoyltransferase catalytic subunit n=1 Tax=Marinicella rhabdoformis TaxID=2580566 RepID=UPI0012AECE1F|nr:aspartate carbamoyltransferase catalytic subunit [Marinicella rhabdoformis]